MTEQFSPRNLHKPDLRVRDASEADVENLCALRYVASPAIHLDRLRDARNGDLRYLLIENASQIVGFGVLVFRRPTSWSDAGDASNLPQIVDLFVAEKQRGQGIGSFFIVQAELIAREKGCGEIFIGVDPIDNPRAHSLYLKLGYAALQSAPHRSRWRFFDSDGVLHAGDEWHLDLKKSLR